MIMHFRDLHGACTHVRDKGLWRLRRARSLPGRATLHQLFEVACYYWDKCRVTKPGDGRRTPPDTTQDLRLLSSKYANLE